MDKYPTGSFGWVDLYTSDDKSAVEFYSELFNWKDDESASAENGYYHQMNLEEKPMTGIYSMDGEKVQNIPPHWTSYILVDDADEITSIANANGATIIYEPCDILTHGRMALLTDPIGVGFGLWQPKDHVGSKPMGNKHGAFCWNELLTSDVEESGKFYCDTFGWNIRAEEYGSVIYYQFNNKNHHLGGMMAIDEKVMGPIQPHWNVYFVVSDTDESVKRVEALGGETLYSPFDIRGVGRIAVVEDPQGATFSLIKPENHPRA